jgi:hypothetical protein
MKLFDAADAVRKLVTTPDDLGACQQYCEALKAENVRLRELLRQVVANGVDDYWVTTDEGAIWLDWVRELTKEAKAALEGDHVRTL